MKPHPPASDPGWGAADREVGIIGASDDDKTAEQLVFWVGSSQERGVLSSDIRLQAVPWEIG